MKILVVSYSLTGNNAILAESVAAEFSAKHIKVSETKVRTLSTIMLDNLFDRIPKVRPHVNCLNDHDLVILMGPVWMGNVAAPLRAYLRHLGSRPGSYAFVSVSGGSEGDNPKLSDELKKRVGREPLALIDLHIAQLLPAELKPSRDTVSAYRLNDSDIKRFTNTIVNTLCKVISRSVPEYY